MASLGFAVKKHEQNLPKKVSKLNRSVEVSLNASSVVVCADEEKLYTNAHETWAKVLIIFNMLLFILHTGTLAFIISKEFKFPLTFFYTTVKDSILAEYTCIYDYGETFFNSTNTSFCSKPEWTITGDATPPRSCDAILAGDDALPGVSSSGGPLLQSYEITRFGQGSNTIDEVDDFGRTLSKLVLIIIESTTALAHVFYTILFARMLSEIRNGSQTLVNWFIENGGLPIRWIEYAVTYSLMTLFIANTANLFEFFGVLAITLASFSAMFFGLVIEAMISQGRTYESLMLLYIPGFTLFVTAWAPILQSLSSAVFQLSCQTYETDTLFSCSKPTCFGREVPIPLFSLTLLLMFCAFPIILVYKLYILGGWSAYLNRPLVTFANYLSKSSVLCLCLPVVRVLSGFMFLVFLISGGLIAWFELLKSILSPFISSSALIHKPVIVPKNKALLDSLFLGELWYAIASATSKLFLAMFFTINFSGRDW